MLPWDVHHFTIVNIYQPLRLFPNRTVIGILCPLPVNMCPLISAVLAPSSIKEPFWQTHLPNEQFLPFWRLCWSTQSLSGKSIYPMINFCRSGNFVDQSKVVLPVPFFQCCSWHVHGSKPFWHVHVLPPESYSGTSMYQRRSMALSSTRRVSASSLRLVFGRLAALSWRLGEAVVYDLREVYFYGFYLGAEAIVYDLSKEVVCSLTVWH